MRRSVSLLFLAVLLMLLPFLVLAQSQSLSKTQNRVDVDGTIAADEYSFSASFDRDRLKLYLNLNDDGLFVGITAETRGWVGVGFGSLEMNRATILVGYVKGPEEAFRIDDGRGHTHSRGDQSLELGHDLSEEGRSTTMEVHLDAAQYIKPGQTALQVIVAYGNADSFRPIHRFKTAQRIPIQ
jgi:hypothetical protein